MLQSLADKAIAATKTALGYHYQSLKGTVQPAFAYLCKPQNQPPNLFSANLFLIYD